MLLSEKRHRLELLKVNNLHSGLPAHYQYRGNIRTEGGEISNNIIECMMNNILESDHTKSPLHRFKRHPLKPSHQHNITTNSSLQQLKMQRETRLVFMLTFITLLSLLHCQVMVVYIIA